MEPKAEHRVRRLFLAQVPGFNYARYTRPEKLKTDGSEDLVIFLISGPNWILPPNVLPSVPEGETLEEKIESIKQIIKQEFPNLKFEVVIHQIPVQNMVVRYYIPKWPQLGSLIYQLPELFVFRREAYQKLCTGIPLRYDEIYCISREYVPIENFDPTFFEIHHIEIDQTHEKGLLGWIRNGFVIPEAPLQPMPPSTPIVKEITPITLVPEIFVHLHHPCSGPRCSAAPGIIKEALGDHFEIKTHIAHKGIGCAELPTFTPIFYSFYPVLTAMTKKTYQKLLDKQTIEFDEVEVFAGYKCPLRQRITTDMNIELSVANIRKWLKLEKENLP